ncbi:S-layer homology domain-containing protein [Paenibacillus aurantius]|uniref:S-layer homology domain-containing protein n=1 Tax=Paenibacillus aurantius TaxID=2918900 RepID=A0AA96LGC6_9BACL|nr:S-layer homology domain-containing protein [Paenibacillus aurantius]WNQ11585.1 S-layer homology domain-containing protein [Paenibacillus aurantius]
MKTYVQRGTSLLMAFVLLVSLFPAFAGKAQAAANFFTPDDVKLAASANIPLTSVNRSTAFLASKSTLPVTGTFQYVASDSLSVKVEQLSKNQAGQFVTDNQHVFTASVAATSSNKFEARNVELFPGYNQVTFTGMQGGVAKADVFYVLYEDIPYLRSLKVGSGNDNPVNLNEGTSVVMAGNMIYLQGEVQNGSRVWVNGSGASILEDGTFFSPTFRIKPGKNRLDIIIENQTNQLKVSRDVYYYDPQNPFVELELIQDGVRKSILDDSPSFTGPSSTGQIRGKLLVPDNGKDFFGTGIATIKINTVDTPFTPTSSAITTDPSQQTIPGNPSYRLIDFTTNAYSFQNTGGVYDQNQSVTVSVNYDNFTGSLARGFQYLPNEVALKSVSLLPNFNEAAPSIANAVALNNSEVKSETFYILAETDKPFDELRASLQPLATVPLNLTYLTSIQSDNSFGTAKTAKQIYKVTGLPNGSQQVKFQLYAYNPSPGRYLSSTLTANVNYVSTNYISVDNLYDGQSFSFDSSKGVQTINVKGQFVGFKGQLITGTAENAELFINGVKKTFSVDTNNNFDFNLIMNQGGTELYYGENRIVFTARYVDNGTFRDIEKQIKIYIIDTNVATIERFQPVLIPKFGRTLDLTDEKNIFKDPSPDFVFSNNKYTTTQRDPFDLVLKGSGAKEATIKLGGTVIFSYSLSPVTETRSDTYTYTSPEGTGMTAYDLAGKQDGFVIRLKNIKIDVPGSQTYVLELTNTSGAKVTRVLELVRQAAPYTIKSPKPTVGDRIVVNKNFIHFDIDAEGADSVTIEGQPAVKRPDYKDRFIYDYVGLKPDKENSLKITIKRGKDSVTDTVKVFYTSSIETGTAFEEKINSKHSVLNKGIELSFPKGTILKKAIPTNGIEQFYDSNILLFGIANPSDGSVEKVNDYGEIKGLNADTRTDSRNGGHYTIPVLEKMVRLFTSTIDRSNFTTISPIYYINGGVAENYNSPATNGLDPYAVEGTFTEFEPQRKLVPTNRGTLKLKFNTSVVDEASSLVTVFKFTERGKWENIGGEVDSKANTITVPFDEFGYYMVTKLRSSYKDITDHGWARNVLDGLYSKGLMVNIHNDSFGAYDMTSRGEFATLLVKSLNIPLNYEGTPSFTDISPGMKLKTWDYEHIETAARAGIVTGIENGIFGAIAPLTREQAAAMIARALELKLAINDDKLKKSLEKNFTDAASIDFYAVPAIDAVFKAGIMLGEEVAPKPGEKKSTVAFNPKAKLTRDQAGKIAVRLLQKSTKIFPKNLN